ncbi:unnamed protein product [Linum trigynum]|uniref:Uncharacterized protein n=1 Tax=Linum trigynum TaxID=586398 RepID=A0AAV2CBV5_9ROSI
MGRSCSPRRLVLFSIVGRGHPGLPPPIIDTIPAALFPFGDASPSLPWQFFQWFRIVSVAIFRRLVFALPAFWLPMGLDCRSCDPQSSKLHLLA